MEVECDNCGEAFDKKPAKVRGSDRDFCSRECYYDFGRPDMQGENNPNPATEKASVVCESCGDTFEVYPHREDSARFCSQECHGDYLSGRTGPAAPRWQGSKETIVCKECGCKFRDYASYSREYCSKECYREASKDLFAGEGNPVWRGGRVDNYGPNWQAQRQKALDRDGRECQDCGKPASEMFRSPDVHHKKRLGWFKEEYDSPEWYEKGNRLDNLVTLCPRCHAEREGLGQPVTSG